jgi:voltage-gated potassium channel
MKFRGLHDPIVLMVLQLVVLAAQPLLLSFGSTSLLSILFCQMLLFGSISNWKYSFRKFKIITFILCLLLGLIYYTIQDHIWIRLAYISLFCILLLTTMYIQINNTLVSKTINRVVIITCINSYILAAYLGASAAWLIEVIQPGSFQINHPVTTHQLHDFIYFSFVTLATLGYGDITPVSEMAKIIAVFISLFGQLYVAVFLAIILGKYLQQKQQAS